jgi:tellurite resistance protein TehA-like permease
VKISERIRSGARNLSPGYFSLIMATGIIGNSANASGLNSVSKIMFYINTGLFLILLVLILTRLIYYFSEVKADLRTFEKNPGFLTLVAASGVYGVEALKTTQGYTEAMILLMFALMLWLILMISFFILIVFTSEKPSIEKGLNGLWLLLVVSTQAVSILSSELSSFYPDHAVSLIHIALMSFLLGCGLYLILIPLILYRLVFFTLPPSENDHSYWIDTGAAAISVVSGLTILDKISAAENLAEFLPFIKGMSLLFWVTGTWWIPMALTIEIWRYFFKKITVKYHPVQWSMIFVVGNYSLATTKTGLSSAIPALISTGKLFLYLSLFLWVLVFSGMIYSIIRK